MAQVGRISGPLLTANLERNGIDLAFRDTLSTTQLLYLDVNNGKVGVNKNAPLTTLNIDGEIQTTNLLSTTASISNFNFNTNNIDINSGDINFNANRIINVSTLKTDNILINDNTISSYNSNSNLDLNPNGAGIVDVIGNTNVTGNLHATGNITSDSNITLGSNASDNVIFDADINSNIIPASDNTYSLGSPTKRWSTLYSNLLNGNATTASTVSVGTVFHADRQGNTFWVAQNGDDTNVGDHPNGPFKTLKRALDAADASAGGPVLIHVMPGGYEEELPLVVPSNVTIRGEDMRNTIIRPESAYQSEDVFHLNGETTVQNITIKDFYYDSINDKGYAFRFAPNTVVSTRSPYVQNVSVITQGTTTSPSDPRGFASGDAGKGALVDGASVLSASNEASMLFHSVTFITPGVDALTMTNGVRVEWLNSFTYFANRGLYAKNGVTGHLSTDGSTIQYGAELRSIGSANVYGNYGAVADGNETLMYLIQHNFAYIGVGKYVDNDPSRVIQSQETTKLNSGKIYFQSIDHTGGFRVGENFHVDFETGETTLTLTEGDIDSFGGLTITTNGSQSIINGTLVETGNLRFINNDIISLAGAINVNSANEINFLKNTNVTNNLDITGDLSFGGTLNSLGDQTTDTIDFNVDFDQNLVPNRHLQQNLGSELKIWDVAYGSEANLGNVQIYDTTITTNDSNADLELRANGTGIIYLEDESLTISNNLQVNGLTTLSNISGSALTSAGGVSFQANFTSTNLTISDNLTVSRSAEFEEILLDDNFVTTTSSNTDLELRASGTGNITIPDADLLVENNFDVQGTVYSSDWNVANQITANNFNNNTIRTSTNVIETFISNANLDLSATGDVKINDSASLEQNLSVTKNIIGNSNLTTDFLSANTINITDSFALEDINSSSDIQIFDNVITTTNSNSNLELRAHGAGSIYLNSIEFTGNTVSTGTTDDSASADLSFSVTNNLIIDSNIALKLPNGPDKLLTQGQIRFNTDKNIFQGFSSANEYFSGEYSDDSLTNVRAHPTNNTLLIDVAGIQVGSFDSDGINIHGLQTDDILIDGLSISTNVSNSNLELVPDGSGKIVIDKITFSDNTITTNESQGTVIIGSTDDGYWKFSGTGAVKIPVGDTSNRPVAPVLGQTRINTDGGGEMETWNGTEWATSAGKFENVSVADMEDEALIQSLIYG